jgi:hypothetical protein
LFMFFARPLGQRVKIYFLCGWACAYVSKHRTRKWWLEPNRIRKMRVRNGTKAKLTIRNQNFTLSYFEDHITIGSPKLRVEWTKCFQMSIYIKLAPFLCHLSRAASTQWKALFIYIEYTYRYILYIW